MSCWKSWVNILQQRLMLRLIFGIWDAVVLLSPFYRWGEYWFQTSHWSKASTALGQWASRGRSDFIQVWIFNAWPWFGPPLRWPQTWSNPTTTTWAGSTSGTLVWTIQTETGSSRRDSWRLCEVSSLGRDEGTTTGMYFSPWTVKWVRTNGSKLRLQVN